MQFSKRFMLGLLLMLGLWVVPLYAQDVEVGYQEALRRIEEAQVNGVTELDLSGLFLTTVPPEVGQLTNLKTLRLMSNQLTSIRKTLQDINRLVRQQTIRRILKSR